MIDWSKVDTSVRPKIVPGKITMVFGKPKKIHGGVEERRRVKYNGKQLRGYIRIERSFGETNVTTHFKDKMVEGKDTHWLLRRNSIICKPPIGYVQPVVLEG